MEERLRHRYLVRGRVQGVGFRPFVYRLATSHGLGGLVRNAQTGVIIEVEGSREELQPFVALLRTQAPAPAVIESIRREAVPPRGDRSFGINASTSEIFDSTNIPVDTAPCPQCLAELTDRHNRRYRYPFISCASCGPRYSILYQLPFDREHTSLSAFPLRSTCLAEYTNPHDRRFHAETIGCHACGPEVWVTDNQGHLIARGDEAISHAARAIARGDIVALKGVGGFHLLVDGHSDDGVLALRNGKQRGDKPFGILYRSIDEVARDCVISDQERTLLLDPRRPLVFLSRRAEAQLSEFVAPGSPYLGAMLPSSPLHYLVMEQIARPVVATSGNRGGEPIASDTDEAVRQLGNVASFFLVHNRPICNPCDDSIWQIVEGCPFPRRMGRGYAPYTLPGEGAISEERIATGGITKSCVAVGNTHAIVVGPYGGSAHSIAVMERHESTIALLSRSQGRGTVQKIYDLHPDWTSPRTPIHENAAVQHHLAHGWSAIVDGDVPLPVCAIVWDGAGYGIDETIWGGEWLILSEEGYERRYHLKPFWLLGGDRAVLLPERSAAALWYGAFGESARTSPVWARLRDQETLWRMIETAVGCTVTTSMGRLFDGIAAAVGVCQVNTYEGEAAMRLEAAARCGDGAPYPFVVGDSAPLEWASLIEGVQGDLEAGVATSTIGHRFHQSLIHLIGETAERIGLEHVVLTGGCFQNILLLEGAIRALRRRGFSPHWQQRIPCHDEGLSVGQIAAAVGTRSHFVRRSIPCV